MIAEMDTATAWLMHWAQEAMIARNCDAMEELYDLSCQQLRGNLF